MNLPNWIFLGSFAVALGSLAGLAQADTITTDSFAEIMGGDTDDPPLVSASPPDTFAFSSAFVPTGGGNGGGELTAVTPTGPTASASGGGNVFGDFGSRSSAGGFGLAAVSSSGGVSSIVAPTSSGDLSADNVVMFSFDVPSAGILTTLVDRLTLEVFDETSSTEKAEITYSITVNGILEYGFTATLQDNDTEPEVMEVEGDGPLPNFGGGPIFGADPFEVVLNIAGPSTIGISATTSATAGVGGEPPEFGFADAGIGDPPRFDPEDELNFDPSSQGSVSFQATAVPEPASLCVWLIVGSLAVVFGLRKRRRESTVIA